MAVDNNREDCEAAIEIPRMIQTHRRPNILKRQKRSSCVFTYEHATPRNKVYLICIHTLDAIREVKDLIIRKN